MKMPKARSVVVGVLFILVIMVSWSMLSSYLSVYKTETLNTGNAADPIVVSFKFDKHSRTISVDNRYKFLEGRDLNNKNTLIVSFVAGANGPQNCDEPTSGLTIAFVYKFEGQSYQACSATNNYKGIAIISNFKSNNRWHSVNIYSADFRSPVDIKTAETILNSLHIN